MSLKLVLLDLLGFTQTSQQSFIMDINDNERAAIGTPTHWSARDHVAHFTFWKNHLAQQLEALWRSEVPPGKDDTEVRNWQVFEQQRERSWEEILLDAQQAPIALLAAVERFTEDDLIRVDWFPPEDGTDGALSERQPLWSTILGNGFWHLLEHFTQFYLDRKDVPRATQLQQAWTNKVMQPEVPATIQSIGLYTLALFYSTTKQVVSAQEVLQQARALNPDPLIESFVLYNLAHCYATTKQQAQAQDMLRQALTLNPDLTEFASQDPDMASLLAE